MKPIVFLHAGLFLVVGLLAGCDAATGANGTGNGGSTSPVGVWTSATDVITLRSDGTATDLYSDSGSTTADFRYSGTWSVSGSDLTLSFPSVDSSTNGILWYPVADDTGQGGTVPFSLYGNTLVLDTGSYSVTYTRTSTSGGGTTSGAVSAPVFSAPSGTYSGAQLVTIACATSGAAIYYTVDGSYPTTSSLRYNGAIPVSSTTTIRAVAIAASGTSSVSSVEYTIQAGGTSTSAALAGTWKGIFSYSQDGFAYQDTVEITLYASGNLYRTRRYSETDPDVGDVGYYSESASGTWSATATLLTTTMDGRTSTASYTLGGGSLVLVDAQSTPSTRAFRKE